MKYILITGANRGLGLALAEQFSNNEYSLLLVVRSEASKTKLLEKFPAADVLVFDVTDDSYPFYLEEWLGNRTLDIVINNAGSGSMAPTLASTEPHQLRKEFETNCIAVLSTVKASLIALKRSSSPLIINISSRRGSLTMQSELAAKGTGCSYSYRVSKAAQNMLSLCLADDLEDLGIAVVSIHPGRLLTKMASSDADMTADDSAKRLVELVESGTIKNRDFISLETGKLPW
ncbi:Short chain dehydrogenase [Vibrio nigripulchritudo MADA3029]|uniref:SDR family NAD(P)-dependent oxidoreductase n=1 Tax=Vibrio nigripulchritudo TaxID=28173 RepID=UPI0003B21646|nr:SDR family NAD(P)-dependent oxidoreductase [Vibrio nigripulchritudo]CCN50368.1 Short chain dehydrogenase [Vibrio nigripulchritudo MADA3020]CCN52319.1 Short chain dehydrogenase [Vibrio nigripulchritudo MADA3021]CCN62145.1 Short chain dehydrogenase [Vibrio nigripulchritudo MADA3029]BCL69277.1 short-chain dehydrogenase [Vibrio nigripulchritudo]BDU30611.1 short-chain dehydrogenase [Vibrio nigripulchritudo]